MLQMCQSGRSSSIKEAIFMKHLADKLINNISTVKGHSSRKKYFFNLNLINIKIFIPL